MTVTRGKKREMLIDTMEFQTTIELNDKFQPGLCPHKPFRDLA